MKSAILKYELSHWIKQYPVYLYAGVLLLLGVSAMMIGGDILQEVEPDPDGEHVVNSQLAVFVNVVGQLNILIFFLLPMIYGAALQRDYRSNMYMVLYSYPIRKFSFLFGKYISASLIAIVVVGCLGLGLIIGEHIPGLDPALVGSFQPWAYVSTYLIFVIPNILIFGGIVFALVGLSRSIYAGYVTVLLILVLRTIIRGILGHPDYIALAGLLDPYGTIAGMYYAKDWTLEQQNTLLIPIKGVVIYNRFFWGTVALIIMRWAYKRFELSQYGFQFSTHKKSDKGPAKIKTEIAQPIDFDQVMYDFSLSQQIRSIWALSLVNLRSIIWSKAFLSILIGSAILMILLLGQVNPDFTTRLRPFTHVMLMIPTLFYGLLISFLTFIYVGYLIHRDRASGMNPLIDTTPVSSATLLGSKIVAIVLTQILLLSIIILVGVGVQTYHGHYNYDIGQYVFHLYGITLIGLVIWGMLAMFVQVLFTNQYVGVFIMILALFGVGGLKDMGVSPEVLRFNDAPRLEHSDMDGFGVGVASYFIHKFYWFVNGLILLILTYLIWPRGHLNTIKDRYKKAKQLLRYYVMAGLVGFVVIFLGLGYWIYINTATTQPRLSKEEMIVHKIESEKELNSFFDIAQPSLSEIKMEMDLYPDTRTYKARGVYQYINKSTVAIDTLWIAKSDYKSMSFTLDRPYSTISNDSILNFAIIDLDTPLEKKDILTFTFIVESPTNSILENRTQVKSNGTFLMPEFPAISIVDFRIRDTLERSKRNLSDISNVERIPSDSTTSTRSYVGEDFLHYEAIVSTKEGQIAIAPGELIREWKNDGRHYFQYKNRETVRNGFVYHSGSYEVLKEKYKNVNLEIYHHPEHKYNLNSMMSAMKATLDYCQEHYAPYQFNQMRIVEFPLTYGRFAQAFANTIPFSEMAGFMSNIDTTTSKNWDSPFRLTAHEMSHEWWGHQVVPADARGSKFITEGMAEFVAAKVLGHHHGVQRLQNLLEAEHFLYFRERRKTKTEFPLVTVPQDQSYVAYQKGCMAIYAISQYIGEDHLNGVLSEFANKFRLSGPPYPTSIDMIGFIKRATPDSLLYLVEDYLEKVILYDNRIVNATVSANEADDLFTVDIDLIISKYSGTIRSQNIYIDENGNTLQENSSGNDIQSLPLNDYIEIGIIGSDKKGVPPNRFVYKELHKFDSIVNRISLSITERPVEIVVDPQVLLLDSDIQDNRRKL